MPKVSIILTSYNHEKYISAAIESALNQTFSDFELLIFDDGSTDNSHEIIKSFKDSRIKAFLNKENIGAVQMIQAGVKISSGEYIAVHHSDDVWENTKLEKQVNFLENNSEYEACFTQAKFIDEHGETYNLSEKHHYKEVFNQENRSREEWLNHFFWKANCLCHPSILARNHPQYFIHNPTLFQLPDFFTWVNLLQKKNIYVLEEELIKFRLRRETPNSVSSLSLEKLIRLHNEEYFVAKEFMKILDDEKFFLKVFPEAEKFLINGEINTKFAFAQLCIEKNIPAYQKLALEILYELLHNENKGIQLKRLYNYDEKSFAFDNARLDVFKISSMVPLLHWHLKIYCEKDFSKNQAFDKIVLIQSESKFSVNFDFNSDTDIENIRFSLPENLNIAIKILEISVNGKTIENFNTNAIQSFDSFFYFFQEIPLISFNSKFPAGKYHIVIVGVTRNNLPPIVNNLKNLMSHEHKKNNIIKIFKKTILKHIL